MNIQQMGDYLLSLELGVKVYFNKKDKRMVISHNDKKIEISETSYSNWKDVNVLEDVV